MQQCSCRSVDQSADSFTALYTLVLSVCLLPSNADPKMKAYFGKMVGTIGAHISRRRHSDQPETQEHELSTVSPSHSANFDSVAISRDRSSSSSTPIERISTPEADEVLYRKNNVMLKYPIGRSARASSHIGENGPTSSLAVSGSSESFLDNQVLVPGFLFVTTRGSKYGSTLILNWAPNSSMRVPDIHAPPVQRSRTSNSINSDYVAGGISDSSVVTSTVVSTGSPRSESETSDGRETEVPGLEQPSCSSVSIDLGMMEKIRIFYNTDANGFITSGEMVISGKDKDFKVFYFKTGGLNDLVHLLRSWKYFNHVCHKESHQHTFTIFRPKLSLAQLHPDESNVTSLLTEDMWRDLKDSDGRITERELVLKVVFFQGMASSLRKDVWPYLLGLYQFDSSEKERTRICSKRHEEYLSLDRMRKQLEAAPVKKQPLLAQNNGLSETSRSAVFVDIRSVIAQIDKDVVRTDRSHPYYKGEGNDHVRLLMNILLNYLIHKPQISYSQGMTDLLAPLLAVLDNETDAFWCFTRLVESTAFFKPGKNHISVKHQLEPLRLLIEMLIPTFYSYLEQIEGGLTLMFCHRWLLVCLKREFPEEDALPIWEACWASYVTNSFHLFICIAIMAMYGQKAIDVQMNINELMVFFNTLSHSMPRDIVLSQARGYLHQFCTSFEVNCALSEIMNKEFWEREDSPKLACSVCRGIGSCARTGFVTCGEVVC